jgi:hypothetical protein
MLRVLMSATGQLSSIPLLLAMPIHEAVEVMTI